MEENILQEQTGFRRGRLCTNNNTIRQLIEKNKIKKNLLFVYLL